MALNIQEACKQGEKAFFLKRVLWLVPGLV